MGPAISAKEVQIGSRKACLWGYAEDASFREIKDMARDPLLCCAQMLLRSDACIFDVGANIGMTAIGFAQMVPQGKVFAFEPSPRNYELLQRNLQENSCSRVEAIRKAVGRGSGEVTFVDIREYGAGSFAVHSDTLLAVKRHADAAIKVPCTRLDDFVAHRKLSRVDLIKIDVEGFELDVLEGAKETLETHKPITILEFNSYCFITHAHMLPTVALEKIVAIFPHLYVIRGAGRAKPLRNHHDYHEFVHDNIVVKPLYNLIGCFDAEELQHLEDRPAEKPPRPERRFRHRLRNRIVKVVDRILL